MAPSPAYTAGDFADALDAVAGRPRGVVERGARDEAPEGEDFLGARFGPRAARTRRTRRTRKTTTRGRRCTAEATSAETKTVSWRTDQGRRRRRRGIAREGGCGGGGACERSASSVDSLLGSEPPVSAEDANDEAEARRRRIATRLRASEVRTLAFFETAAERVRVVVATGEGGTKNRRR